MEGKQLQALSVPLTQHFNVKQGSHILYFYNTLEGYIENATSFIITGLKLGQQVVFIDSEDRFRLISERLKHLSEEDKGKIHYVSNYDFYEIYGDFHFERVLKNLQEVIQYYIDHQITIRLWGHVDWMDQDNMLQKLHTYECNCDITIAELGYTTVCSYNGDIVPANILTEMMKSHEYLMTDTEFVRSNLYKSSNKSNPAIFPSLAVEDKLMSEMDLYKQKLDFVHVVSHEVRNPLTVIKNLASLLMQDEENEGRKQKLSTIQDYTDVIDHEISHIISTEQMLSTDALWQKKLIAVLPAIEDVVTMMSIKAKTQNITLHHDVDIPKYTLLLCNLIGFKLIISNLISNSIKYSYEGNDIFMNTYIDKQLVIEVIDQGVGMTKEQLAKLYIKYEKLNTETSGQGIGLFMVKKLVDHFNGSIEVESDTNKGTRFLLRLPIQV
jgi:two-component sensor histidine kinase